MSEIQSIYNTSEFTCMEMGTFHENRNLDVHIDQFSEIASNWKRCHLGLLYTTETIESVHIASKHVQILYSPCNLTGHWVRIHITAAVPLIFMISSIHNVSMNIIYCSKLFLRIPSVKSLSSIMHNYTFVHYLLTSFQFTHYLGNLSGHKF